MFKYTFILLFLSSSCSLYNFSDSKDLIDDIFDKENESTDCIFLITPSIEDSLVTDNLRIEAVIQDALGISTVTLKTPLETIEIVPVGSPAKYGLFQNISLKNGGTYDTATGKYDITISYKNNDGVTVEKEFTLNVKILSVDYFFVPSLADKPTTGSWGDSFIRITDDGTGASLQSVKITGTLGNHTYDGPFTGPVEIRYDTLSPTVPAETVSLNLSIISDTGGVSTESIVLD